MNYISLALYLHTQYRLKSNRRHTYVPNWKTTVKKMVRNGALRPCDFGLACYKETSFSSHWEEIILMSLKWVKTYSKGVVPIYALPRALLLPARSPLGCMVWLPILVPCLLPAPPDAVCLWVSELLNFYKLQFHHLQHRDSSTHFVI